MFKKTFLTGIILTIISELISVLLAIYYCIGSQHFSQQQNLLINIYGLGTVLLNSIIGFVVSCMTITNLQYEKHRNITPENLKRGKHAIILNFLPSLITILLFVFLIIIIAL